MKSFFLRLKSLWLKFAHAVGWFNTRVLLTATYFTVIAVPGIIQLLICRDALKTKPTPDVTSYWNSKEKVGGIDEAKRQF